MWHICHEDVVVIKQTKITDNLEHKQQSIMRRTTLFILSLCMSVFAISCSGQSSHEKEVLLETTNGEIRIKLYDDTPHFRDNFIKNVKAGLYDGVYFHRIIRNFMIQTGDPNTRPGQVRDTTQASPMIPNEIVYPTHFHKRGVLAAAKEEENSNPNDEADQFQFYIVTGKVYNDDGLSELASAVWAKKIDRLYLKKMQEHEKELNALREERNTYGVSDLLEKLRDEAEDETPRFSFTPEQIRAYKSVGGAPWLDSEYTVFGEVVEGMKTVLNIERTKTNKNDEPLSEVRIIKATVIE